MMNINISLDDDFIQLAIDKMVINTLCGLFNCTLYLDDFFEELGEEFSNIQMTGKEYLLSEYLVGEGLSVTHIGQGDLLVSWGSCSWEEPDGCLAETFRERSEGVINSLKDVIRNVTSKLSTMEIGSPISILEELDRLVPTDLTPEIKSHNAVDFRWSGDPASVREFHMYMIWNYHGGRIMKDIRRAGIPVRRDGVQIFREFPQLSKL